MTVALLDGDVVAYRAAIAAESDVDWGDGENGKTVNSRGAIDAALRTVEDWRRKAHRDVPILCFSPRDGGNFRRLFCPSYKPNRPDKPKAYWAVVDALEKAFKHVRLPFLEADDVMGILSTSTRFHDPVIVTIDKDLCTIPGWIVNPLKWDRPRKVRPLDADKFWMTQTLKGDRCDGYPGCPGVGEVGAAKLIEPCRNLEEMWDAVVTAFANKNLTVDDALLQARLARILRRADYDSAKETVSLWHPIAGHSKILDLKVVSSPSTPRRPAAENPSSPKPSRRRASRRSSSLAL